MSYARVLGTGGYLPERVLTNAALAKQLDTQDEWIRERTGIAQRHLVSNGQTTCDLAEPAARRAIDAAGINPQEIDLLVMGTTTPDLVYPATACRLQARLGIRGCPAFDVQAVCTGFVYALSVADQFIRTGSASCALVVGADANSRILDWSDRTTCVLFGDGAGAVVLGTSDEPGILSTHLHADGRYEDLLFVDGGVFHNGEQRAYVKMQGSEVFKFAVKTLGQIVEETLAANNMSTSDIDWLVPHQANTRIISATAKKLGMPLERVIVTVQEHGNTSAASVPLAMDVAVRDGRIQRGDVVLLEAFGGGFTWGSALLAF